MYALFYATSFFSLVDLGPFFPKRGQKPFNLTKTSIRPPRPQFQMFLHSNQLESSKVSICHESSQEGLTIFHS